MIKRITLKNNPLHSIILSISSDFFETLFVSSMINKRYDKKCISK